MADTTLVNIFDARYQLEVEFASLFFGKSGVPHDVVEKLTTVAVLHDHVKLFFRFNDLVKLNYVGVSDFLENFDFSGDTLDIFLIMNLVLLENFDGHLKKHKFKYSYDLSTYLLSSQSVLPKLYLSKCSLTKMFSYKTENKLISISFNDLI